MNPKADLPRNLVEQAHGSKARKTAGGVPLSPRFTDCVKTPERLFGTSKNRSPNPSPRIKTRHIEFVEVTFLSAEGPPEFSHSLFIEVHRTPTALFNRFQGFLAPLRIQPHTPSRQPAVDPSMQRQVREASLPMNVR